MVRQRSECSFLERSTATLRPHTSLDKTHPVHLSVESTFERARPASRMRTSGEKLERETGIEPATNGLGSRYSTIELLPLR